MLMKILFMCYAKALTPYKHYKDYMISLLKNADDLQQAWQLIQKAHKITLLTHYNPDGDGISACAALAHILEKQGKSIETVYPTKTEEDIKRQPKNILIGTHQQFPDLIITCDTSVYERLYFPDIFKGIPLINIDHHLNNKIQGIVNFVSVDISSTCELLYLLLQQWFPDQINTYVSECLLYGILYDTQVFYNQATHPSTLRVTADLIDHGADLFMLQQELLCNKSPQIIKFWGELLSSVTITPDKKAAWIIITQQDLKGRGLTLSATVGFSNFLAQLSGIDITILFYESEDGKTKVSLRSKISDVNTFANQFGGGGHKNASGITSSKLIAEMVEEVVKAL